MDDLNKIITYSIIGIVAVFFATLMALQPAITGDLTRLRDLFRGQAMIVGDCTTAKDSCSQDSFCSAKLMVQKGTKLKGTYSGYCITKYNKGHLCKKDFQCKSNQCLGVEEMPQLRYISMPIGGCA